MLAVLLLLPWLAPEGPLGLTGEATRPNEPAVALNPFGSLFTVLSWSLLLGVNLYCFWRVLHPPSRGDAAAHPPDP
ncbi:MAG: hypothetical protein EYC70_07285 [Planctomycetota bacterium]|nr:MAG: hypothetical protein EYC70_07285 [Planctomycetota bacterium]